MKVYLVLPLSDMLAHELIEVCATEEGAIKRVAELNAQDGVPTSEDPMEVEPWGYDEREVKE